MSICENKKVMLQNTLNMSYSMLAFLYALQ